MPFYDDDGTEINPDLYPKPQLCLSCKKNDDLGEYILCTLNRLDQRFDSEFICGAYEPLDDVQDEADDLFDMLS